MSVVAVDGFGITGNYAHLDVSRPAVEVQVQVLDLAVLGKLVRHILLGRLLVNVGYKHYPSLDGCPSQNTCQLVQTGETINAHRAARVSCVVSTRSKACSEPTPASFPPKRVVELCTRDGCSCIYLASSGNRVRVYERGRPR